VPFFNIIYFRLVIFSYIIIILYFINNHEIQSMHVGLAGSVSSAAPLACCVCRVITQIIWSYYAISNPISLFLSWKSWKLPCLIKPVKNASVGIRTQNISVAGHHLYHRPIDYLYETHSLIYLAIRYYKGDLFKSQSDSLVFLGFFTRLYIHTEYAWVPFNQNDNVLKAKICLFLCSVDLCVFILMIDQE